MRLIQAPSGESRRPCEQFPAVPERRPGQRKVCSPGMPDGHGRESRRAGVQCRQTGDGCQAEARSRRPRERGVSSWRSSRRLARSSTSTPSSARSAAIQLLRRTTGPSRHLTPARPTRSPATAPAEQRPKPGVDRELAGQQPSAPAGAPSLAALPAGDPCPGTVCVGPRLLEPLHRPLRPAPPGPVHRLGRRPPSSDLQAGTAPGSRPSRPPRLSLTALDPLGYLKVAPLLSLRCSLGVQSSV
jgi:hypothetical protein